MEKPNVVIVRCCNSRFEMIGNQVKICPTCKRHITANQADNGTFWLEVECPDSWYEDGYYSEPEIVATAVHIGNVFVQVWSKPGNHRNR